LSGRFFNASNDRLHLVDERAANSGQAGHNPRHECIRSEPCSP
jgi:hypothetical protein